MINNILKIDGIENNIVNHKLKKECGYKYTSIIANYKFETIIYNQCKTFNSKIEYDGDYKIKSIIYKKIKSKYKKISIKEFFNNNEIVEKLIQLAIFNSLQYNLADYAKNTFLKKYPLNAYDWDFCFNKNISEILSLDKLGYSIEADAFDILLVVKYILPSNRDENGNRFVRANYLDDSIKAYDEQYNAYVSLFSLYKYINDNDELIKILDNFLTTFKTSTKDNQNNSKYTHKEYEQDPDWNNAIVFADDEEDCGCGSR